VPSGEKKDASGKVKSGKDAPPASVIKALMFGIIHGEK
jgi:hypothetical protein